MLLCILPRQSIFFLFNIIVEVDVCMKTNYDGFVYWGEYPLNFAAVLNQEECYRLMLKKGANHDLQDTNGNTITHIMVVYDNMKMFDLAVEAGAAINILNNQQLTPLSTASFLARTDMFFHIANIEREVYWQIGRLLPYTIEYFYVSFYKSKLYENTYLKSFVHFKVTLLVRHIQLSSWIASTQRLGN